MALIRKTILWICLMSCIGLSKAIFVTPGRFDSCSPALGVNDEMCGRRATTRIINLQFSEHCYLCNYGNKTVFVSEGTLKPSISKDELRVGFGVRADETEAPWAVWIIFYSGFFRVQWCSGSLITLEWVVTAAHCLHHFQPNYTMTSAIVYAGSVRKESGNFRYSYPDRWFVNHDYQPHDDDRTDIGVMKLIAPFTRATRDRHYTINTVCLPDPPGVNHSPDIAAFFGFGRQEGDVDSPWLMKGVFWLTPFFQCIYPGTLCANLTGRPGQPATACSGDSGGGLVQYDEHNTRAILAGVLSGTKSIFPEPPNTPDCGTNIFYNYWVPAGQWIHFILDILHCVDK